MTRVVNDDGTLTWWARGLIATSTLMAVVAVIVLGLLGFAWVAGWL